MRIILFSHFIFEFIIIHFLFFLLFCLSFLNCKYSLYYSNY
nr:MAG TPA: hypothetical protein [Caudoviricetes sp.]